jgi:uncharacterized membrane protein
MKEFQPMATVTKMLILCLAIPMLVGCERQAPEHPIVVPNADRVSIRLAAVNDGGVHFFTYKWKGKNINFFVRTDGTGQLQAHLDACYSCFKYKLGYVQEENQVVCIACRIGYLLDDVLWDYVGACAPISLNSRISDECLIIKRRLLEKGKKFF